MPDSAPPAVNRLAALPTPPPVLPAWAKVLYYLAETVAIGVGFSKFDFGAPINAAESAEGDPEVQTWRRFVLHWSHVVSQDTADDQVFTIDIVNITGGQVDSTWTDADYQAVFGHLGTMATGLASAVAGYLQLTEIKAYVMAFRPYGDLKPFVESGAPEAIYTIALGGGSGSNIPPQPCSTLTEETADRGHWGRVYLPTFGHANYAAGGRLLTTTMTAVATAFHDAYAAMMGQQFFPVVPTTQIDKAPGRTLQTVTGVRIDDVPDVHRSRRFKRPQAHVIQPVQAGTLPAPPAPVA